MNLEKRNFRRQYKMSRYEMAKFFAVPGCERQSNESAVLDLCLEILDCETRGDLRKAAALLAPYRSVLISEAKLTSFSRIETANFMLRAGSVISALGNAEQVNDSQEQARSLLHKAEEIFTELNIPEGRTQCLNKIGVAYFRNGELETAQIYFRESLLHAESEESKAIANLNIAMIESLSFRHSSALQFYEKAYCFIGKISVFTEAKIRNGMGLVYKDIGNALPENGRAVYFDKAIIEFEGALVCYEEIGNDRSSVLARNNIGFLYYSLGLYNESLRVLEAAALQARRSDDKNHLSIVCDTRARALIAQGNYRRAIEWATDAVSSLAGCETSNLLVTALITCGIAYARNKEPEKSKSAFEKAEETAAFIQDFVLVAAARLFSLSENYDEYDSQKRLSIYQYCTQKLADTQEKDIRDALDKVKKRIEKPVEPLKLPGSDFRLSPFKPSFSLDAELKSISRRYITAAMNEAHGNQSQAAALLGMSRQTLIARIKKDFPDLFPLFNRKSEVSQKSGALNRRLFVYESDIPDEELALTEIQDDFGGARKGDILLVKLGLPEINSYVVFCAPGINTLKISFFTKKRQNYILEAPNGGRIELGDNKMNLIMGQVVGFCRHEDFQEYLVGGSRRQTYELSFDKLNA